MLVDFGSALFRYLLVLRTHQQAEVDSREPKVVASGGDGEAEWSILHHKALKVAGDVEHAFPAYNIHGSQASYVF